MSKHNNQKWRWIVNVWLAISFFMIMGPGLVLGNRIYPFVWGVPFYYFWNIIWFLCVAIGLIGAATKVWKVKGER